MNEINRKNVNDSQVRAQDFPHSGFDLSYKSRADFILGQLKPIGYQYIMPGDKFSGSTEVRHTFNRLVVPEISDVNVSLHHFYVPFRAIDSSFIKGIVPTELNGMSSTWRVPSFSLNDLIQMIVDQFGDDLGDQGIADWFEQNTETYDVRTWLDNVYDSLYTNRDLYYLQSVDDIKDWYHTFIPSGYITSNASNIHAFLTALLQPLFGRNSLLDMLGYQYIRTYDIQHLIDESAYLDGFAALPNYFSTLMMSEYAIRAYYAIWYEHYRDKFIQKRSTNLPDWRDFGSTSLFTTLGNLVCFLTPRIRSWSEDMFTTSKPDDISRHVYAPILNTASNVSISSTNVDHNYLNAETGNLALGDQGYINMQSYNLTYISPVTGSPTTITCPIPKAVNDTLNNLDTTLQSVQTLGLDLRDLRKSQMLERYLKRNFYFGDEYQDRMLAHYGSKVSDNSIKRPHLIASDGSQINPKQEVASIGTEQTPVGTRTATAQDNTNGNAYEFFSEEFGIFMTIMSIVPRAQYSGVCPQNLLSQMTDFPLPEFAASNDETGRVLEIAMNPLGSAWFEDGVFPSWYQFGHYPYAHGWRSRVDEVHGSFLDDRQDYTFRRFFGGDVSSDSPKLNSDFLLCRPNLGMFADQIRLDGQGYYTADNHFYVERVLPTPVEEI